MGIEVKQEIREDNAGAERFCVEEASVFFGDVRGRLDALGISAHGSSFAAIWGVRADGDQGEERESCIVFSKVSLRFAGLA
jgi:hypothetical protein